MNELQQRFKFRGKTEDGRWLYDTAIMIRQQSDPIDGTPFDEYYIGVPNPRRAVRPETVGQFTGFTDDNGKEIYEGDIIECEFSFWMDDDYDETLTGAVVYTEGSFAIESGIYANMPIRELHNIHIIDNETDNPDILNHLNKQYHDQRRNCRANHC